MAKDDKKVKEHPDPKTKNTCDCGCIPPPVKSK